MVRRLAPVLALVLLAACGGMSTTSDYDRAYDFAGATTFAFPSDLGKGSARVGEVSPLVAKRVMADITTALEAKGFGRVESPEDADLVVVPHGGTQEKTEVSSTPYSYTYNPWWGDTVDVYQYTEGTMVIDFVDRRTGNLVWRGSATAVVDNPPKHDKIEEAVTRVLETFPPRPTQGGSTQQSSGW